MGDFKPGSAIRREKGPAPNGVGSERMSSPSTQIAQPNRTAGEPEGRGGAVLRTPLRRGRGLAKRGESQGGSRGTWRQRMEPDRPLAAVLQTLLSSPPFLDFPSLLKCSGLR